MIFSFNILIIGLAGGLLTASWGAFKDSSYEGFSLFSFLRSLVITCFFYSILLFLLKDTNFVFHNIAVLFAAVAMERITQEYWKAFFRFRQRKNVYKIPQSFHVLGKVVEYKYRLPIGITLSSITIFVVDALSNIEVVGNSWVTPGLALSVLPSVGGGLERCSYRRI